MKATNQIKIGNMGGGGDIVAKKMKQEDGTYYVKIFQREKKPMLFQALFRLHDFLSKNHNNITLSLNSSTLNEADYIAARLITKKYQHESVTLININENIDKYFSFNQNHKDRLARDLSEYLHAKNPSYLTDSEKRYDDKKNRQTPESLKCMLDQIKNMRNESISEANKDFLLHIYNSEIKYFSYAECSQYINIKISYNLYSDALDPELKKSINFLDTKLFYGPAEIPFPDIENELKNNLDSNNCRALYKKYMHADWDDTKNGSIVDYVFKELSSDLPKMKPDRCRFLFSVFDDINKKTSDDDKKLNPCFEARIKIYLMPVREKIQSFDVVDFESSNY